MVTLGIDEAGRGAWAGPLVVGAVVLGNYNFIGLTDSKQLTKKQRSKLAGLINFNAVFAGLGWVSAPEIDRLGLTRATILAIERAIEGLDTAGTEIIIDGHLNYLPNHPNSCAVVKADLSVPSVSAASIIAKVARDKYMADLSSSFPAYGFDSHVGYGTQKHLKSISDHGLLDIHRRSFKPVASFI